MKPELTEEQLGYLVDGSDVEEADVYFVANQRGPDRRWESEWLLVVEFQGKLWGANYREPLTEMQDAGYGPFEYGCEWFEVEPFDVVETRYHKKKAQ